MEELKFCDMMLDYLSWFFDWELLSLFELEIGLS